MYVHENDGFFPQMLFSKHIWMEKIINYMFLLSKIVHEKKSVDG